MRRDRRLGGGIRRVVGGVWPATELGESVIVKADLLTPVQLDIILDFDVTLSMYYVVDLNICNLMDRRLNSHRKQSPCSWHTSIRLFASFPFCLVPLYPLFAFQHSGSCWLWYSLGLLPIYSELRAMKFISVWIVIVQVANSPLRTFRYNSHWRGSVVKVRYRSLTVTLPSLPQQLFVLIEEYGCFVYPSTSSAVASTLTSPLGSVRPNSGYFDD